MHASMNTYIQMLAQNAKKHGEEKVPVIHIIKVDQIS